MNNAAYQQHQENIEDITDEQLDHTFKTNIYGYFRMAKAALPHLREGSAIVNTGSITGLQGNRAAAGLFVDKRRDPRVHEVACADAGRAKDPRELRFTGPGVDSAERRR